MKRTLALQHIAFEHLGSIEPVLRARDHEIQYIEVGRDDLAALDPRAPELVVILGGPIGAYQDETYPFLRQELEIIATRLDRGLPVFGLCLGSQLIARALNARVYPGPRKEIGWAPITLTQAGQTSCLNPPAAPPGQVLHWHGDTFDLPVGATRLASSTHYENQAFSWGTNALALQFHPEVLAKDMERWLIGHAFEIATTPGISVTQLRTESQRWGQQLERFGTEIFRRWLEEIGL